MFLLLVAGNNTEHSRLTSRGTANYYTFFCAHHSDHNFVQLFISGWYRVDTHSSIESRSFPVSQRRLEGLPWLIVW